MLGCFGFGESKEKKTLLPFTNFVLRVDATGSWESTVAKVLKKTKEVSNCRMYRMHDDEYRVLDDVGGLLQISGTLDPVKLLKVLAKSGKAVHLVDWKFGGCSRNLVMPEFEHYQQRKRYLAYLDDMQVYYNTLYHGHGYGRGNHGYNYVDSYGYGNAEYLPSGHHHGHHHPHAHFLPTYSFTRQ